MTIKPVACRNCPTEEENTILRKALKRIGFGPDLACNWLSQEEARDALQQCRRRGADKSDVTFREVLIADAYEAEISILREALEKIDNGDYVDETDIGNIAYRALQRAGGGE